MIKIIGLNGSIGSTLVLSQYAMKKGIIKNRYGMITKKNEFSKLDLIDEKNIEFSGWDIVNNNMYEAAKFNKVVRLELIELLKDDIQNIIPEKAVCFQKSLFEILSLENPHVKDANTLKEMLGELKKDIEKKDIVLDISSTESFVSIERCHQSIESFMELIDNNEQEKVTPSMLYALAAVENKSAFIEFTPNFSLTPAIISLAKEKGVPVCGKDGSTGQTLYKTVIADMLKCRNLKLIGWYSTNILGNNDGKVLSSEKHVKTKIDDKYSVLAPILNYSDFTHTVDIRYYPPRGDNKEAWDNIDFLGWLDEPMCMKINWLGKDSILAVPLVFDLIRLVDFAKRNDEGGIQNQLAIFFKNPIGAESKSFLENYAKLLEYVKKKSRC